MQCMNVTPEGLLCMHALHAEPWSLAKERAGGEACARYSLGQVDAVVEQAGMSWEELMLVSVRRVRKQRLMRPSLDMHAHASPGAWHQNTAMSMQLAQVGNPLPYKLPCATCSVMCCELG